MMDQRIQHIDQRAMIPKKTDQFQVRSKQSSFKDVFKTFQNSNLKVSKHAQSRLDERNIEISSEKWKEIENQVNEAKQKGIKDSLVVTNEATLLISAENNTVVTAMDRQEAKNRIFTNINGTIVLD